MAGHLGRLDPPDWEHVEKWPLTIDTTPAKATPVVLGISWFSAFDNPVRGTDGRYYIGKTGSLGYVRGGHAICALPSHVSDLTAWWAFYSQGNTGECVGFSCARAASLENRARYDAPDLYFRAQDYAGQDRDPQAGTYVRAALEVLRTQGPKTPKGSKPSLANGIAAYRWATDSSQVLDVLQAAGADRPYTKIGAIPLINSWGQGYRHVVWLPTEILDLLLNDGGEAGVIVDR